MTIKLPDLSPDGFAEREGLARHALATMQAISPVDEREHAAKDSFVERLTVTLAQYELKTPQSQVSVITSELHSVRSAFDLMPTVDRRALANIAATAGWLPPRPSTVTGRHCRKLPTKGTSRPSDNWQAVVEQIKGWTGDDGAAASSFFHDLVAIADVDDSLQADLARSAQSANEAFA